MLNGLGGFEWDAHNIGHIARHGVTPMEVEETTGWRYAIVRIVTANPMNQAERRIYAPQIDA